MLGECMPRLCSLNVRAQLEALLSFHIMLPLEVWTEMEKSFGI